MLNWRTMSEDEFNRIAEALIRRSVMEDSPGVDVKALDGRGGDGGIDLDATVERTGQLVSIYQLKFFPEGFSGEWSRARKPQIQKSFNSALTHEPPVWHLVVPRNLTPKERTFVRSLQEKRRRPMTRYLGAAELDHLLVRYPDIDEWAQRDPLRTALGITGRSTAALSKPGDLGREVMELAHRIRPRSDYWDIDFSRTGDLFTETLIAKRPDADEREPLSLSITTDFTEHPELRSAFRRSMQLGLTEPLVLPDEVVKEFEQHGPEWFAGKRGPGRLEFHPSPTVFNGPSFVKLLGPNDRVLAQRNGVRTSFTSGTHGGQLTIDLGDHLVFTFVMKNENRGRGDVEITSDVSGLSGAAAKRALRFLTDLSNAEKIVYSVDGRSSTAVVQAGEMLPDAFQVELADDLATIEEVLNVELRYPASIDTLVDRIWVRVIRHILEGKVSLVPGASGMNFILNGELDPGLEGLLEAGGAVRQSKEIWETELLGQAVTLDDVSLLMPSVTVEGGGAHLEALRAGTGEDRKVSLVPSDGVAGILIWSPTRIGDMQELVPTPWDLADVREHRQIRAAEDGA